VHAGSGLSQLDRQEALSAKGDASTILIYGDAGICCVCGEA